MIKRLDGLNLDGTSHRTVVCQWRKKTLNMGKANKKKKKNADFVKPKLKVGKKKPNATNFTNVAFKSSAINMLAQLEEKTEPTNRRNLSLKDILHQMDHYNDNTRQDATESLRSFFVQYPSSLHQNLNIFIPKLLSRSVDMHFNVRKHFVSCLEYVFRNVGSNEIQPFFPVIMAHLNCAMTHINEDIQSDSLKFLGLCLDVFPNLFLENCEKVFHNFLDIVYQSQGLSLGGKDHSQTSTAKIIKGDVSIQPIGKLTSAKIKKDILEKLLKIVSLVFMPIRCQTTLHRTVSHVELIIGKSPVRFSLFKYKCIEHQGEYLSSDNYHKEEDTRLSDGVKSIKGKIMSFVPVLFQCWNDCRSSSYTSSATEKESTLQIMMSVVSMLRNIVSSQAGKKEMKSFVKAYFYDFAKYFLESFPISLNLGSKMSTKQTQKGSRINAISLNIFICEIYCKMISSSQSLEKDNFRELERVLGYIRSLSHDLKMNNVPESLDHIQETVCIIMELLFNLNCSKDKDKISKRVFDILKNFTIMYKETKSIATKLQILPILEHLLQLMDDLKSQRDCITEIFETWVCLLPGDLKNCDPENSDFLFRVIAIISTVLKQKEMTSDLKSELHSVFNDVIDAPRSIFTVAVCELSLQRKFLEMIYYLPHINRDLVKSLSFLCHRSGTSIDIKNYISHILYYCLLKRSVDLGLFLSFVLSVLVGSSLTSLESIQSSHGQVEYNSLKRLKYTIGSNYKSKDDEARCVADHVKLCEAVMDLVQTLENKDEDILGRLLPTLDQLLTNYRILPDISVIGLLSLLRRLLRFSCFTYHDNYKNICDKVAELMFSVVIYRSVIESNRIEFSQWSQIAFEITCKLLHDHDNILDGWINTAIAANGSIEDSIIAKGLRCLKRQPMLNSKLEIIFTNQKRTERLRKLCYNYSIELSN